jgi:hypothetical protein
MSPLKYYFRMRQNYCPRFAWLKTLERFCNRIEYNARVKSNTIKKGWL